MLVLEVAIHLSNAGVTRRIETLEAKEPGYLYYFAILDRAKRMPRRTALTCMRDILDVAGGRLQLSIPNYWNEMRLLLAPSVLPPGPSGARGMLPCFCSLQLSVSSGTSVWGACRAWAEDCLRHLRARSYATQEALLTIRTKQGTQAEKA